MFKKLFLGSMMLVSGAALADLDAPSFYVGPTFLIKANTSKTSNVREVSPRLSAGYGGTLSQGIYLAGELFLVPSSLTIDSIKTEGVPGLKTTYAYGLSAIPGLMINESLLLFLRLGAVKSHFSSENKTVTGLQAGFGLQTKLTSSWDLRGEYVYTKYNSLSGAGNPKSDWFGLGGVYNF